MIILNWCSELTGVWTLLGYIKNIAYIFVPALLIIMGAVTFLKAVVSQKEDALKTAQKQLTNKIIAAVAVFLVVTAVDIVVGLVADEGWKDCAACFIKPTSSECKISKANSNSNDNSKQDSTSRGGMSNDESNNGSDNGFGGGGSRGGMNTDESNNGSDTGFGGGL